MTEQDCLESLTIRITRIEERMKASDSAIHLATSEMNRRLHEMNELREQISNERTIYLSRTEYYGKHDILLNSVGSLQKFQWTVSGGLLVFQVLIAVVLHFWK